MGSTVRYLAIDGEDASILEWFGQLEPPPVRDANELGTALHFAALGPLVHEASGAIDTSASPIVTLYPARSRRAILWTAGEVHFLPVRGRQPGLDRIHRQFVTWLKRFDLVFSGKPGAWDYYLEGSIRNYGSPVYALPQALAALGDRTYFVGADDSERVLDQLCRSLALRGVMCGDASG
jgi:hypothetical protein